MPNDQPKRRTWPTVIAVLVLLPVLYVLSIGPFMRLAAECFARGYGDAGVWVRLSQAVYAPLHWAADNGPDWFFSALKSYIDFWATLGT